MIDNIYLIVIDALRRDHLGCYGHPFETSPNIDAFAKKAIIYDNAWTVHNKTDVAFTTIETGLYPKNHGILTHIPEKVPEKVKKLPTIATELRKADWITTAIDFLGRWHKRGYDVYSGLEVTPLGKRAKTIEWVRNLFGIHPGKPIQNIIEKTPLYNFMLKLLFDKKNTPYMPADDVVYELINSIGGPKNFVFAHFWDTHIPYWAPKEHLRNHDYSDKYPDTDMPLSLVRKTIKAPLRRFFFDAMMQGNRTVNDVINQYDGEIRFIDHELGKFFKEIDRENSMVVICADHGESMVEDGIYFTHDGFADCVMRIPLIIYYPGCFAERIDEKVSLCDIAPTILNSVDIDINCDGKRL